MHVYMVQVPIACITKPFTICNLLSYPKLVRFSLTVAKSLIFEGKASSRPTEWSTARRSTRVGSSHTLIFWTLKIFFNSIR
jgi:hypothetical protein